MNVGDRLEVLCDRLSYGGGRGVARANGAVIFIDGAAPKEKLSIEITKAHKNFFEAKIVDILSPSTSRRDPKCVVFDRCGGCTWQHITYQSQIEQKTDFLKHFLRKVSPPNLEFKIYPAPEELNYRNRIQVHVHHGQGGYYERGSNSLVVIKECPIAAQEINKTFKELVKSNPKNGKYEIAVDESGETSVTALDKHPLAFRQVNFAQNQKLIDVVLELVAAADPKFVIELYAGSGNFTFPLAKANKDLPIYAVEENPRSVLSASRRAHRENLSQLEFIKADATRFLRKKSLAPDTLLLVDPPRAGLASDLVEHILSAEPSTIIYISCNLSTLERDLVKLSTKFDLISAAGVDMFPQTDYLETVVELALRPRD